MVRLPERQLDAVTGLSGSGPAYVFLVAEAMIEAGVSAGLTRDVSRQLVVGTFVGSARMLDETGQDPAELRAAVTSPGGTTAAAVRTLEFKAVRSAFIEAVAAAVERSRQLGPLGPGPRPADPDRPTILPCRALLRPNGEPPIHGSGVQGRRIPEATVARLPVYQRILEELLRSGTSTVSSELLGAAAQVNAAKVRKDLSLLGSFGTRGAGYDVAFLVEQIDRQLGLDREWTVAIAGIGNLGRALARSQGFASRDFRVAALIDTDPAIIGERIDGVEVHHPDDLPAMVADDRRWPSASSPPRRRWPSGWPTC